MCTPTALTALFILQGTSQFLGQQQAAGAEVAFQEELGKKTARAANAAFEQEAGAIGERTAQERKLAAQKRQQVQIESAKARSRAALAAGESGARGRSVGATLQDIDRSESLNIAAIDQNVEFAESQAARETEGRRLAAINRRITPSPVIFPSLLTTGLSIASRAAGAQLQATG